MRAAIQSSISLSTQAVRAPIFTGFGNVPALTRV
jgi:hypothetical protein